MSKIIGNNLPDMPWQEKPAGEHMPVWRYDQNPIIGRYEQKRSNSIFQQRSRTVRGRIRRCIPLRQPFRSAWTSSLEEVKTVSYWEIEDEPIKFEGADEEILTREYRYDPRVCKIDDKYYVTWCNGYHGPTIGVSLHL